MYYAKENKGIGWKLIEKMAKYQWKRGKGDAEI
jgi:hypothetical protein